MPLLAGGRGEKNATFIKKEEPRTAPWPWSSLHQLRRERSEGHRNTHQHGRAHRVMGEEDFDGQVRRWPVDGCGDAVRVHHLAAGLDLSGAAEIEPDLICRSEKNELLLWKAPVRQLVPQEVQECECVLRAAWRGDVGFAAVLRLPRERLVLHVEGGRFAVRLVAVFD